MNNRTSRGPRPGRPDVREQIRQAARTRFLAEGYRLVTLRSIAGDVGVDVALVSYYFGSKQGLFNDAMDLAASPGAIIDLALEGDLGSLADRLIRGLLAIWDDPSTGAGLKAIATTAVSEPEVNRLISEMAEREIVTRLANRLPGDQARARASAFCTQMSGLILSRYLLHIEPMASMAVDEVTAWLAPSFQLALGVTCPILPALLRFRSRDANPRAPGSEAVAGESTALQRPSD